MAAPDCDVDARLPLRPCAEASAPERAGVWQQDEGGFALVYDGCFVAFEYHGPDGGGAPDWELRSLAGGALVIDWRTFGDPPPYYRARARWRDDVLGSFSIIGERTHGRWDADRVRMRTWRGEPLRRVSRASELSPRARRLVCVERVTPTETELALERGLEPPSDPDATPLTPSQRLTLEIEAARDREVDERIRVLRDGALREVEREADDAPSRAP